MLGLQDQLANDKNLLAFVTKPKKNNLRQPYQSTIQQARSFPATIKPRYLQHKTKHEVRLSDVEDGPLKFNIQLEKEKGELETLMSNLKYLPLKSLSNPLFIGDACLALHSKTKFLRRAIVSQIINLREAEVWYCDFGDREILHHSSIYEIPSQYLNPQALSVTLTLSGAGGLIVTQEMKNYFKQLVLGKKLTLVVMPPEESPLMHCGDLLIGNESVSKLLLEAFPDSQSKLPEAICLTPGTRESVHVSYTFTCSKFFVHLDKNVLDIEFLLNHFNECAKQPLPIDETIIKPGLKCLAYSSFYSKWYRAEVLSLADNHVTIHYIDYGNEETLPYNAIRSICCDEITKIPNQAVQCVLNGFESVPYNPEVDDKFEAYVLDKSLVIAVLDVKPSGIVVDLYDSNVEPNLNISEKLKNVTLEVSSPLPADNDNWTSKPHENSLPENTRAENLENANEQNKRNKIGVLDSVTAFTNTNEFSPAEHLSQITPPNITFGVIKHCEIVSVTSPADFYVQLIPNNFELYAVMDKIAQIYETGGNNLSESNVKVGTSCVAQYSEDLKWYRAVVKSVDRDKVTVRFVDYGNVEAVTFDKIKEFDAELAKLPIQAINCKLFAVSKTTWDSNEVDEFISRVEMKSFEVEFIFEENHVYEVLLREVVNNETVGPYLNKLFSNGADLMQAKEVIKNKNLTTHESISNNERKWGEPVIKLSTEEDVIVTWLTDPDNFYCQLLGTAKDFQSMMNEIQKIYLQRQPAQDNIIVGSSVIAVFADDGAFYRAEVIQKKSDIFVVRYVDFGNTATVKSSQIYRVDEKLMNLPKQAVLCGLKNVVPLESSWSIANYDEIDRLFDVEQFRCKFQEVNNNKYLVLLTKNGRDLADILVQEGFANFAPVPTSHEAEENIESNHHLLQIDMSYLRGQTLRVKVSKVETVNKFYIQLLLAKASEDITNNNQDQKMLALSELPAIKKQAVECSLVNADSSSTNDNILRNLIENKEVIIRVNEVNNNRLVVEVFDISGEKIKLLNEYISPLCSMPIFLNKYHVTVSHVNNSKSIWLTREDDTVINIALHNELFEYYSKGGKPLNIEVNMLCAAESFDGNWYRAKIVNKTSSGAVVLYVDYGNTEEVNSDKLKELTSEFLKPFQLAIEVKLGFNLNGVVREQEILSTHLLNQSFYATLQLDSDNQWLASLSLKSGELLENHLRNLGFLDQNDNN